MAAELTADNLQAISRVIESVNEGRVPPEGADGTILDEGFHLFLTRFRRSFPDLRFTAKTISAGEDEITAHVAVTGTHQADFRGIPATGRRIGIGGTIVVRLSDGDIREAGFQPRELNIRGQLLGEDEADVPWYKHYGGGAWDLRGQQQLDFLRDAGLRPHHHLLDIGCGTLRGGVKLIPYLDTGHYWGVDPNPEALAGAREALAELQLESRQPRLVQLGDFDFQRLDQHFDYYLAYSLFTEIPLNAIVRCVVNIDKVLSPGASFYATFWENPEGKRNLEPIRRAGLTTYFDAYPYHYDFATFEWACRGTGLEVEHLGKWCVEGPQSVMLFTRR